MCVYAVYAELKAGAALNVFCFVRAFYRYEFIKQTIVYINAQSVTIACPNKCLYMDSETSTLRGLIDSGASASMTFYG